jgi:CrcB protein
MVVAGGMVGTTVRALVGGSPPGAFPWRTLIVNLLGTAALAVLIGMLAPRPALSRWVPLVGVGVMGSLTTFGTMMVEIVDLARNGAVGIAALYTVSSVTLGLTLGLIGLRLGEACNAPIR